MVTELTPLKKRIWINRRAERIGYRNCFRGEGQGARGKLNGYRLWVMGYGLLSCLGARGEEQGARGLFYLPLYTCH